ncbi:MAG: carbon-nitrogen family hydrolase [Leptolyngbya sp. PLA1]|nr:carbon-nitrogen family hydrolase [Leptolyngbya sp. PLA1]
MPRAHLVQLNIAWEDPAANLRRAAQLLAGTHVEPGDLILLPEMFATGFSFEVSRTADHHSAILGFLRDTAQKMRATVAGGRTLQTPDGRGRNVLSVAFPDGSTGPEYAKVHPFPTERTNFDPGDEVLTWPWGALSICPAICYDLRFPELFRLGLKRGASAFAVAACWPSVRHAHWRALLLARAIENQAFVLACNRVGREPGALGQPLDYSGGSIVIGPKGDVLAELGSDERVLSVDIDPDAVSAWRRTFRAWQDARL